MLKTEDIQIRDPFIVPVESAGTYYMYGSTDKNIWGKGTGFDVYVSRDLEMWEGPFPVFRPPGDFFADNNFWAPEVYSYQGRYYMFATFRRRDNQLLGTAVLAADSMMGPFHPHSDGPVTPSDWSSLDGSLHIDEEGQPWMVFCHEWQQITDGQVCAVRLSDDLKQAQGDPVLLFSASEAPWTTPLASDKVLVGDNYVTDGPYLFKGEDGRLFMLWASFIHRSYALGIAVSASGKVTGPWMNEPEPLYSNDGGHGMLFRTFEGKLMLTIHTPNKTPLERPIFIEVEESNGKLRVTGS
ncbi:glycoside hydrolase family 43 protein [Paenibacillus sepulcri]|uniref:Glycoside hydrolase family 43 protein n=1 Tax=Paenibacillus sepulcri TaxID=359917 RepID=A0ABS7C1L9_9BACL|nr:glycoside hydrolase family 43 protein [Paenibacillus sepulcri]